MLEVVKEALERILWRTRFRRSYGLVVRQKEKWKIIFLHVLAYTGLLQGGR